MRSSKDRSALFDIRDNAALARGFVGTLTLIEFKTDRRAFLRGDARPRNHIGGLHGGSLPSVRSAIPSFRGVRIMGVGNVLRHNYVDVAEEQVWRTVLEDLPAPRSRIAAEMSGWIPRSECCDPSIDRRLTAQTLARVCCRRREPESELSE
jgi:uncharacterized protein with HEPN domain